MLNFIVSFALRFRGVVIALGCLTIAYGLFVAAHAKLDVFPEFVQPQATVQTEAPGLSSEQVEILVTRPLENELNGVGNLESIRSESIQGLSVITVVFKEGTDIHVARQMLGERIAQTANELPVGVKAPKMSPLTSSTMDLLKFGLTSDKLTPTELRSLADWVVRPRVLSVPGVAKCSVFGGEVRQMQIQVRPDRLRAFDLTISDVVQAAKASTGVRGAGFIETPAQRIMIETEGQSLTPEAMGEVVVLSKGGRNVRLKDLADVVEGAEPKFGNALIMGRDGVLLTMSGQYGANTMEVTEATERALEEMRPLFASEGVEYVPGLHRPATFIEHALRNVKSSLFVGAGLVALVLFLFLLDLRTAFVSFAAIPLSLLAAVIVLDRMGVTLNTMTLGGFAVAIGVVVDDAIIDVENILRRLRENQSLERPRPLFGVLLAASIEVRGAIVYATFIVALVFLPVLMMSGLQGRFFAPLGMAFILAVMASLAVALTVTPALCGLLFSHRRAGAEPGYIHGLKGLHRRLVAGANNWPKTLVALALLLTAGALATLPLFKNELLPQFREGHLVLQVSLAPGASLDEMTRLGREIAKALLQDTKHVATVEQQIGRAEMGEDTWGPHRSEFHVELRPMPGGEEAKIAESIRHKLGEFPGIQFEVMTFLGDRISETISGETAPVVINIFGEDLDALDAKAAEVAAVVKSVKGAADVLVKSPPGAPRMAVKLRPERLARFGLRPVEVLETVQAAYQGSIVAQTYEGSRVFDVAVILHPDEREDPELIGSLTLRGAEGTRVPLRELAEVQTSTTRFGITHEGARRRQTVTCNPQGRDTASFVEEARKAIGAKVKFANGVYPVFSGAAEAEESARRELLVHSGLAGVAILLLLAVVFRQPRNLALTLANLPFALMGGVWALFLAGKFGGEGEPVLSLGALVGFVTLFGITMRNSLMMISHFEHLVREEGCAWGWETAARGASERLVPILMTALVTGLGLLPLALGSNEAGREIEGPMAVVILGGLVTSTILNLALLPTLALRFGRFEPKPAEE